MTRVSHAVDSYATTSFVVFVRTFQFCITYRNYHLKCTEIFVQTKVREINNNICGDS